jgi:2-keto-4-pentenoate hydratase/2-oxohepta-3-ene-1,7-dioic acid hydratase in catechol pathway
MKIVRYRAGRSGLISYGTLEGDAVHRIEGDIYGDFEVTRDRCARSGIELLAPVIPPNIVAVGLNYRSHAAEVKAEVPSAPILFAKTTNSVIGPEQSIVLPRIAAAEVDYEAEIAIVIGALAKDITEENALDHVLGYTCANDVSARDCQMRLDRQWTRAKSFDTFCPIGPCIETSMDPDDARVRLRLNGVTMQDSNTSDMIFSCRTLISYISRCMTLFPGTLILTGTPSGVGVSRNPRVFLRPDDVVEVEIDGIGSLRNDVRSAEGGT